MGGIIKLNRKNRPYWEFIWDDKYNGYVYKTKNVYKIFFDNCLNPSKHGIEPDIWIGRLIVKNQERFWVTAEKAIAAKSIELFRGEYIFK